MPAPSTKTSDVLEWRKLFTKGPMPASSAARKQVLTNIPLRSIQNVRALLELHDLVLFALAHPGDVAERKLALSALQHVSQETERLSAHSERNTMALSNTGLAHTSVTVAFSRELLVWLQENYPDHVSVHSVDGDLKAAKSWIKGLLPHAEQEAFELDDFDLNAWLANARGKRKPADLSWWLKLTERLPEAVRSTLFEQLQIYVSVDLGDTGLSATYGRSPQRPVHAFPNGLPRSIDLPALLRRPLPAPRTLRSSERQQVVEASRGILLSGLRETGPVTHADPRTVELIDMGDGIDIALFHLPPSQRQTYDSYIGYVAFLNTVPAAYGGAWMFPGKTKVGVNVFPSLRGGASALLFGQILRCYAQRFGVDRFEADPYQLGHGNADGIASGAYWFYYRLGFRPVDRATARIAEKEFLRFAKDKAHRSDTDLLRDLAAQPLVLVVRASEVEPIEPVELSHAVMRMVAGRYSGDHRQALRSERARTMKALGITDLRTWSMDEQHWAQELCLALGLIADLERWSRKDKKLLIELLRAKGGRTEEAYIALLQRHSRLWAGWAKAVRGRM